MRITDLQSYYVGLHLHDGMVNTDNRTAQPRYQPASNRGSILARHREGSTGREQVECVEKHKQGVLNYKSVFLSSRYDWAWSGIDQAFFFAPFCNMQSTYEKS
jgi:hypothetical protein